jgi:hypothetical protein
MTNAQYLDAITHDPPSMCMSDNNAHYYVVTSSAMSVGKDFISTEWLDM